MPTGDPLQDALDALKAGGTSGAMMPADPGSRRVYMSGGQPLPAAYDPARDALVAGRKGATPATFTTADEAVAEWFRMDEAERQAVAVRMQRAGMISDARDWQAATKAWAYAVDQAATFGAVGKKVTPWDVISMGESTMGALSRGPSSQTQTATRLDIPSEADAKAATATLFRSMMGRDATDAELSRYSSVLIAAARANPSTSTVTTTYDAQGNATASNTVSSGGIGSEGLQQAVSGSVKKDPEYAAYQASTTYFNALLSAIGAVA